MPRVTKSELARRLGVSQQAVSKGAKSGRVGFDDDGKCDLAIGLAQWNGEIPAPRDEHAAGLDDADPVSFAEARRRRELAQAELAQLKAAVMRGDLLDRLTVESQWFATLRTLRDRLMGIPDRLAILVAAESDEHEVRLMLATEIRESLTTVADGLEVDP